VVVAPASDAKPPLVNDREARQAPRFRLTDLQLPGQLVVSESGQALLALAVDVARGGLGVVIGAALPKDTLVSYHVAGETVPMRVCWHWEQKPGRFRHGLQVLDGRYDLEEIFFALGCIDLELDLDTLE
jgi:hypothetical protein